MTTRTTYLSNSIDSPLTYEEGIDVTVSRFNFWQFLSKIFIRSFDGLTYSGSTTNSRIPFTFSDLHEEWATEVQAYPRFCLMAPRGHLKTTVIGQGYPLWLMMKAQNNEFYDIMYFSYKAELANEKVAMLKKLIRVNPYFRFWKDQKPTSDIMIDYLVDWGEGPVAQVRMLGSGIMSATRGRHPRAVICDDILSDFADPLESSELKMIHRIFTHVIMSLPPNEDDPLVVVGTPQSYDDTLYWLANNRDFNWLIYPAIKNYDTQETQWPEKYSFDRLMKKRNSATGSGPTAFEVEYQLAPVMLTEQFLTREELSLVVDTDLDAWKLGTTFPNREKLATYGGVDIGKEVHPSHVCVFLELPNKTLILLFQTFLDHLPYPRQVAVLNKVAEVFNLSRGYYDQTSNVMEDRALDKRWKGKVFTKKLKGDIAVGLEKRIFASMSDPGLILTNHERYLSQICSVTKDFKAPTTPSGHGDSFWSTALAIKAADDGPTFLDVGSPDEVSMRGLRRGR